ncbi:MAG: UvrD-helicase domain-containing protein [Truepera sp.]|nr:UvrD-helicase domain-containing protein [Truepera sp.]
MLHLSDPDDGPNPAFEEEQLKLDDVIRFIEEDRSRIQQRMPATAAHQETANQIQKILRERQDSLTSASSQPYFGRLDYLVTDGPSPVTRATTDVEAEDASPRLMTVYLGITSIPEKGISSWIAPVAKLWYTPSRQDGYTAPAGPVSALVDLKRYLRIRGQRLEEINDIFRRLMTDSSTAPSKALTEALSQTGAEDGHLQIIVETIEPDQYESISNTSDKVLVIQGAAGSGKSEIGFHRIAYLLSPFNDLPERDRPTPGTTLFIGPSQAFLEYAADILPQLGVRDRVQQTRFSQWMIGQMSRRPRREARIWKNLLAPGETLRFNEQAELFKGSMLMADAIDRHVGEKVGDFRRRVRSLPSPVHQVSGLTVPESRILDILNEVLPGRASADRVNRRREEFISRVVESLWPRSRCDPRMGREEAIRFRNDIRDNTITPWCNRAWEHIDFQEEYVAMLSDPDRMVRLSRGHLSEGDANALTESAVRAEKNGFDDSDLGALAYLDHHLNGTIANRYRHIVVDEAQDISPIEFKLLTIASANNWFTVLGDTAQRLGLHRGIRAWRELDRVFGRSDIKVQYARTSYRANVHITRFNNRLLRTFDSNIPAPIPFDRDGHRVEYHGHSTEGEMHRAVVSQLKRVRSLDGLEDPTIAILVRDSAQLSRFERFCAARGITDIERLGDDHGARTRTVLGRIPDAKGLEYDAVIVMGVNHTFRETLFNQKLLYVATTRAKHHLSLFWSGRQSPILSSISDRGIVQIDQ